MVQSLSRALQILIELGEGERSLAELADKLSVHKTTVLRMLHTLEDDRFVHHDADHRYRLGSQLFALADTALQQHAVLDVAAPYLRDLSRRTSQAVHLAAYENGAAIYIDKVESSRSVRMYSRVGLPAPLHCTAVGKVLVAGMAPARRAAAVAGIAFARFTDNTIVDPEAFRAELETVRAQGWAQDHGEHETFINCVGAPVVDGFGRVIAAVSLSVPDVLLGYEEVLGLVPELLVTTAQIRAAYDPT